MGGILSVWRSDSARTGIVLAVAMYVFVYAISRSLFAVLSIDMLQPEHALPPAFGVIMGPVAPWGSGIGYVLTDVLSGNVGIETIVTATAVFAYGAVSYRIWWTFDFVDGHRPIGWKTLSFRSILQFEYVTFVSVLLFVSLVSLGLFVVRRFEFWAFGGIGVIDVIVSSLVFGPVMLLVLAPLAKRLRIEYKLCDPTSQSIRSGRRVHLLWVVATLWLIGGAFVGLVHRGLSVAPETMIRQALGESSGVITQLIVIFGGSAGVYLQMVIGFVIVILYARLLGLFGEVR